MHATSCATKRKARERLTALLVKLAPTTRLPHGSKNLSLAWFRMHVKAVKLVQENAALRKEIAALRKENANHVSGETNGSRTRVT